MNRKHAIVTSLVVIVLGVLVYSQFQHWRTFDWHQFWAQTSRVSFWSILLSVGLTYLVYFLRAVRWMIFLRPAKKVPLKSLIAPQFIGFTGLALLGRPGEFVRPFLIARREGLTFSSQLAVWAVERVFDIGSVALLLGVNLAISGSKYQAFPQVEQAGFALIGVAIVLALLFFGLWWKSEAIANLLEGVLKRLSEKVARGVCTKVRSFGEGLHTIQNFRSFIAILLLSFTIWLCIAEAYIHVAHAYPSTDVQVQTASGPQTRTVRLHEMRLEDVMLVMGASMMGSVVQLPGVGGGSQLAVISLLSSKIFQGEPYNITPEFAASCGIMLWLVTFMSVIPAGLLLAHFNRIKLRELSSESEHDAEASVAT